MKQRILIMNGSKILQNDKDGAWQSDKVEKSPGLKPGIFNIHSAKEADKSKTHDGPIIHSDKNSVYQQVGKSLVKHEAKSFDKIPADGDSKSISYNDQGKAQVAEASLTQTRNRSR